MGLCTDPCRKTTFLLERALLHFHVCWEGVSKGVPLLKWVLILKVCPFQSYRKTKRNLHFDPFWGTLSLTQMVSQTTCFPCEGSPQCTPLLWIDKSTSHQFGKRKKQINNLSTGAGKLAHPPFSSRRFRKAFPPNDFSAACGISDSWMVLSPGRGARIQSFVPSNYPHSRGTCPILGILLLRKPSKNPGEAPGS